MIEIFRKCTKCGIEAKTDYELTLFNKDKRLPYGRTTICKKCNSVRHNKYMKDNRDIMNANKQRYIAKQREALKNYIGGEWKCTHCGFTHDTMSPFDFHHVNPKDKEKTITDMLSGKLHKLFSEVDKCILLCSNCHRIEHERLRK